MQGGVNAMCYFGCVKRVVKEAINVANLVCPRKEIVELPHINVRAVRAKVFITDVGFSYGIDLCICYRLTKVLIIRAIRFQRISLKVPILRVDGYA